MSETVLEVGLDNIKGIGPKITQKLIDGGIDSVLGLAVALPKEIEEILGGKEESASKLIMSARKQLESQGLLGKEFVLASEVLQKRKNMKRITTGSNKLDDLLLGGIETQSITEFFGDFGSGKTQICHTLCVTCQLPLGQGGLEGVTIYVDTEGTFRPERLVQIAESKGLDADEILKNVVLCKVYNSSHLELIVRGLSRFIEKYNAKLLIVDSIISLHRAEFIGRGTLANRQQRLNRLVHRLLRLAEIFNIAVVVTNQVQSKPDTFFGDPTRPAGGNVIAHACTYRIYLKKSGPQRIATIVDSPCHPYSDTRFQVTENGVEDISSPLKKKA
ncbi:DNA repair and recombination protein RadA [Candidatus Bathyarchaeota archaeon]|nr:MAG: DNA repair and recombination protein RadA [Candidatus Bathyarchaeota archaeon]